MKIADIFQRLETSPNVIPPTIPMTGILLRQEVAPLGIFFKATEGRGYGGKGGTKQKYSVATPVAVVMKVTWIAEVGILYVEGVFAGVGQAFNYGRERDPYVNTEGPLPDEFKLPVLKIDHTEFIDDYFTAVARTATITAELVRKFIAQLLDNYSHAKEADLRFVHVGSEAEMSVLMAEHYKACTETIKSGS